VEAVLEEVNKIYAQVGIELVRHYDHSIRNDDYLELTSEDDWAMFDQMCSTNSGTGGIELYIVHTLTQHTPEGDLELAGWNSIGSFWFPASDGTAIAWYTQEDFHVQTVAHEIGHVAGLEDIYSAGVGNGLVREQWEPKDWNGGPDCKYYKTGEERLKQTSLIQNRLVMYGEVPTFGRDIPRGRVYGVKGTAGLRKVGLEDMDRWPHHQ